MLSTCVKYLYVRRSTYHDKQRAQQTASNHRVVGGKNHFGDEHMQGGTGDETLTWKNKRKEHVVVERDKLKEFHSVSMYRGANGTGQQ